MATLDVSTGQAGRSLGKHAVLYCGTCDAVIPYGHTASGPVEGWPYCPVHRERPLIVRSVSP